MFLTKVCIRKVLSYTSRIRMNYFTCHGKFEIHCSEMHTKIIYYNRPLFNIFKSQKVELKSYEKKIN